MNSLDKFFKIKERGSKVSIEVIGGITTFFTMAYIIFVNPSILGPAFGDLDVRSALLVATCISAAIGSILTGFMANVPFAQAPGMGLNAFFTYTIVINMGYSWQQALAIVFVSGVMFLIVAVSPLRKAIISCIPISLKAAIGAGIGLFIAFIGFRNSGIISTEGYVPVLTLGMDGAVNASAIVAIGGLILTAILMAWKVRGAIFIGVIATTIISLIVGVANWPTSFYMGDITLQPTFLGMLEGFDVFLVPSAAAILPLATALISLLLIEVFDTVGTLVGTASNAGMLDKEGNLPQGDRAIIADAIATLSGAAMGTSTVTTYIESAAGISEGARTGLAPIVTGILFLFAILLAPIAGVIPAAATAPALIIVGVLMAKSAAKVVWDDVEEAIPCFLTMAVMPFAYSISDGIGFGFISYCLIKIFRGKAKEVKPLAYIVAAFFIIKYILMIVAV